MQRGKYRYLIELVIHALFWAGVYYVLHSLTASSFNMVTYNSGKITGGVSANMLFPYPGWVLTVLMVMFYGNIFWLFKKLVQHKNNLIWVPAIACWFILMFAINFTAISRMLKSDAGHHIATTSSHYAIKLSPSADTLATSIYDSAHHASMYLATPSASVPAPPPDMSFSAGDWQGMQLVMTIIFLAVLGIAIAYFFIKEWIRNDLARSQAEAQQLSTEVRFLRSQVNPHFLFNTLNNLFSMALKKGDDEVADSISKLSGMMRYMLYESNTENVVVQKEIDYLKDCIALNKLRYADGEVSVNFNYPPPALIAGVQVAPMLFIPFLENAFKHGVLIGRSSEIVMTISVNQKKLTFTCENSDYNAVKKPTDEKSGIGLENVKRRLQLVYAGRHVLKTGPENGKYCVNLQIDIA
ncbi:MAG TPA: sensor histidine kinase [Chitinophagaceae bacterium]|nr:sensor histidine kinase [Chitinophagaceae bacterium]